MFHSFEHFVILNNEDELGGGGGSIGGTSSNDCPINFDKISFLSEQVSHQVQGLRQCSKLVIFFFATPKTNVFEILYWNVNK